MCKEILENGTSTEGEKVRPRWPDGTPALQIIDHPMGVMHHSLLILMLYTQLIAVCLTDGAVFIRPLIPDMAVKVVDIVGLLLPNP